MSEFMMKTVFIKDILKDDFLGKEVSIKGWVYRMRDMKDKVFFVIRDSERARVDKIDIKDIEINNYQDFRIIR